jgi:hypothetical protein
MDILVLVPLQPSDAGAYELVASDLTGSVTSEVAVVSVDPTFTKSTTGPVVSGFGLARGSAWGDYDGDGWLDLFVAHESGTNNALFRNNGAGAFTPVTAGPVVNDGGASSGGVWGDFNNDGHPDLFVANANSQNDFLYRSNGDGTFTRLTNAPVGADGRSTSGAAWADVDNDGRLDLMTVNSGQFVPPFTFVPGTNFLYRNLGDGMFTNLSGTPGSDVTGGFTGPTYGAPAWADFDSDGRMDLFLARNDNQAGLLYRNLGNNQFLRITNTPLSLDRGNSSGGAWGDYDGDGWLDLFVPNGYGGSVQTNFLYRNLGSGMFEKITNAFLDPPTNRASGAVWGDYDNDGFLDLFIADLAGNNALHHNNGDGTFTPVTTGSLVNDGGVSYGCAWADYDNDGGLDLFVANNDQGNFLYRNSGTPNAWLKVRCVGQASNRSGIGAKVRVRAGIGGTHRLQVREITGGTLLASRPLVAHFGLGDATNVLTLRVEWPSGQVFESHNVPVRQFLTLPERAWVIGPPNPGAVLGADFTLYLLGPDLEGKRLQWQLEGVDLPDATNATLVLTAVASNQLARYTVVIREPDGSSTTVTAPLTLRPAVRPAITLQPTPASVSVSLGANLTYRAAASGTDPLSLQWRFNDADLPDATNTTLALANVQVTHAGTYTFVATNLAGAATSQVVVVNVDPAFVKVTAGSLVSDGAPSTGVGWLDLCPGPGLLAASYSNQANLLYLGQPDGTFSRVLPTNGNPLLTDSGDLLGLAVGDYDNDGRPDVYVANFNNRGNFLYHNECNGLFTRVTTGRIATDVGNAYSAAWADFDRDGWLDLYVAVYGDDYLYRNNGNGTFERLTNSVAALQGGNSRGCAWADYDRDGYPDLFVANSGGVNFLFHNERNGTFTRVTDGPVATDPGGNACAWGDYDNDGHLDLVVARTGAEYLYRNNGDGTFTKITTGAIVGAGGTSYSAAWADYDNDGWLDLFVGNNGNNFLFRNNGDGTFTRVTTGSPVNDGGDARGSIWGDWDGDGFPELFVTNLGQNNFLYRASVNGNRWLKVQCVGTASNRSALGARVRVQAALQGVLRWQLRELTSGDGFGNQTPIAMFGLGDAAHVATLRVEWPSGLVQEWRDVAPNQFLTLTEPPPMPRLAASRMVAGQFQFQLIGQPGSPFTIFSSTNLRDWSVWMTGTNASGTVTLEYPAATDDVQRYFQAREP